MTIDRTHRSPNFSSRHDAAVSMIVLHATVGSFASALAWLTNPASRVSSHYLIRKDGYTAQLVDDEEAAWHAGVSSWRGLDSAQIQAQSIGIELENANDGHDPYPQVQIDALLSLCRPLVARYHIEMSMVVRHLDIALPPGRKTDPAGFSSSFLTALYPQRAYRVAGLPIHEAPDIKSNVALGGKAMLAPGTVIVPDQVKDGWAHVPEGFVDVRALEALS